MGVPMSDVEVEGSPDGVEEREARDSLVPYSVDEPHPTGVGRGLLIVLPLVLGLLVVAGIGARMLTAEVPDREAAVNAEAPERCWDGTPVPVEGCPLPTGRAGLRWVFPSFRPSEQDCRDAKPEFPRSTRPTMYLCDIDVAAGPVEVLYTQLTNVARGRSSYAKTYGEPEIVEDDLGKRLVWHETDSTGDDNDYDLVMMYSSLPYAVEVTAQSPEALDEVLDESVVTFRDADDVMTHS